MPIIPIEGWSDIYSTFLTSRPLTRLKGLFLDDGFDIMRSFADIGEFLMDRCFAE